MHLLDHRRFVLGLALIVCLALLGRWALLPDDSAKAPASAEKLASLDVAPPQVQPRKIVEPAPTVAPPTQDSAPSSFGIFRGRVIDAVTRDPVPEFTVAFQGAQRTKVGEEAPGSQTFRADDGRFEWRYALPGRWMVTASAPGYQRFELDNLEIVSGEATPEIVLPLLPGHTLRGRVYDETTGGGIASANIAFRESHVGRFEGSWRSRSPATTEKDGSFILDGVPPGRITLDAGARDYAPRELEIVVGKKGSPLEIGLSAGGTIAGRLTAADGITPVRGTAGLFDIAGGSARMGSTGEAGEFSFRHLPAGRYRLMGHTGGTVATRDIVLASNERMEGIVLALSQARSVRGVVTGLRPGEFQRVSIYLRREADAGAAIGETRVDERGAYVIRGVQPGRMWVTADVSMRRQVSKEIQVPADSDITVNLDFPPGLRLSGRITRDGKPQPRVWIEPRPATVRRDMYVYGASTSAEGRYAIEGLLPGEYRLLIGAYRSGSVQVSGDTVFDVDIPPAQLSGRVLEEGGKVPIVGVDVDIWSVQPGSSRIRLHDSSDHFGQFALAGLEPGDFMLTAYKPGYEMFREQISYGSPVSGMTIRLRHDAGVEISVREAGSAEPLQKVFAIEMIGDGNGTRLQLHLDESGIGYIPSALAGATLSFSAFGYVPAVIPGWGGETLDLQLQRQQTQ